jgi:hypothetical protein
MWGEAAEPDDNMLVDCIHENARRVGLQVKLNDKSAGMYKERQEPTTQRLIDASGRGVQQTTAGQLPEVATDKQRRFLPSR